MKLDARHRQPNPAQQEAIQTTQGPLLIIAGPGSGKTFTLVERVAHLILDHKVEPSRILVSTFTEKAAAELVTRVSTRLEQASTSVNLHEMYLGTLHSLCLRILDDNLEHTRLSRNYTVLDAFNQKYAVYRDIVEYKKLDPSGALEFAQLPVWRYASKLCEWFNKLSEELVEPHQLLALDDPAARVLGACYERYLKKLDKENWLDFSTIQVEVYKLFQRHPDVLQKLQHQIQYLMVDEYQDTNTVQEAILFALADQHKNLCVVGDDDQSLYRFRGATVRNILEFDDRFAAGRAAKVHLTTNYRSPPEIVSFCRDWMASLDWSSPTPDATPFRLDKTLHAHHSATWGGPPVVKLTAQGSPRAWFEEVEAFLLHLRDAGPLRDWNQAAFLFRSVQHDKVVGLIQHLEAKGIPVYAPRSNQFFDREEVQLAFGALIFLFPNFQGAAKRLYKGKDDPSVWAWTEACVKRFAALAKLPEHADLLLWARNKALLHHKLVAKAPHNLSSLFYDLLQFPALARFLGGDHLGNLHDSRPARNLARVSQLLARFESLHDLQQLQGPDEELDKTLARFCNQYLRFLYDGGIEEFEDPSEYAPSGCLSFMTVHQAKGLEFPLALVGSLDASPRREGSSLDTLLQAQVYPKKPFEPPDRIKSFDFWRLYYTAFSRPQELLVLTAHHDPDIKRRSPSAPFQALWDRTPSWRDHADALRSLSLPPVKPVDLKRRYAFTSHVTLYENCPRQYKFFRALQFATQRTNSLILGTLIHETIEDIHHAALRGEPQLIKKKQIGLWLYQNYRRLTAKENCHLPLHLLLSAHEQVMRYVEHVQSKHRSWAHIQEVEVALSLVRGHYILQGAIDLVQGEDLGVEVVDFKSERKPDLETEKTRIAKYKRQLEVYAYLLQTRFQKKVTRLHVHYTAEPSGIPTISFPASQESIDKTLAAFDQVVDKIEAKDFTLSKRPLPLCQRCDMKPYCDRLEKGATP